MYLKYNNLTDDYEYLRTKAVPDLVHAAGKFLSHSTSLYSIHLECSCTGIVDETGEIAAALTQKYLADAELGNFDSMAPGCTDVRSFSNNKI